MSSSSYLEATAEEAVYNVCVCVGEESIIVNYNNYNNYNYNNYNILCVIAKTP